MRIGLIGCGHMGTALASAVLQKNLGSLTIGNPHKIKLKTRTGSRGGYKWTQDNRQVAKASDIVILAVRPKNIEIVLREIRAELEPHQILISIAAGVSLKNLIKWSGGHKKIVRVMPNLAALVGESMSVWKAKWLNSKEKQLVRKFLDSFGKNIEVTNENLIDVSTAISGGGPAYTAAFLESLSNAAKKAGFTKKQARLLAVEIVDGTLDYIKETGIEFSKLKKAVQTKGGITEAGFKVLKKKKWQKTLGQAFQAGYKRTQQLV